MSTHNDRQRAQGRMRRDAMAELVANGATIKSASATLGTTYQAGKQIWARIRHDMGEQAR